MDANVREIREMQLDAIRLDPALQPRVEMDQSVVADYAEAMETGETFPPIIVFYDGTCFWLADGWYRMAAARSVRDKRTLLAEVREGTRRDALLYSLGANAEHGLRRSQQDKRSAVERMLADPEWVQWSDREISRVCRVSNTFVSSLRKALSVNVDRQRVFERGGTVATMDTAPIAAANEARASKAPGVLTYQTATVAELQVCVLKYLDADVANWADDAEERRVLRLREITRLVYDGGYRYSVLRPYLPHGEEGHLGWDLSDVSTACRNVRDALQSESAIPEPQPDVPSRQGDDAGAEVPLQNDAPSVAASETHVESVRTDSEDADGEASDSVRVVDTSPGVTIETVRASICVPPVQTTAIIERSAVAVPEERRPSAWAPELTPKPRPEPELQMVWLVTFTRGNLDTDALQARVRTAMLTVYSVRQLEFAINWDEGDPANGYTEALLEETRQALGIEEPA